ncbi:MAG: hypothetical protein PHE43_04730 [Candidatus Nanoarchaeia archaeon]|nr:hypothetical protein [Candidatus Nanoarchaeia archaeon]
MTEEIIDKIKKIYDETHKDVALSSSEAVSQRMTFFNKIEELTEEICKKCGRTEDSHPVFGTKKEGRFITGFLICDKFTSKKEDNHSQVKKEVEGLKNAPVETSCLDTSSNEGENSSEQTKVHHCGENLNPLNFEQDIEKEILEKIPLPDKIGIRESNGKKVVWLIRGKKENYKIAFENGDAVEVYSKNHLIKAIKETADKKDVDELEFLEEQIKQTEEEDAVQDKDAFKVSQTNLFDNLRNRVNELKKNLLKEDEVKHEK